MAMSSWDPWTLHMGRLGKSPGLTGHSFRGWKTKGDQKTGITELATFPGIKQAANVGNFEGFPVNHRAGRLGWCHRTT